METQVILEMMFEVTVDAITAKNRGLRAANINTLHYMLNGYKRLESVSASVVDRCHTILNYLAARDAQESSD